MAISNYTELKQAIIDWSHREDLDLRIDNFIALAEAEMLYNPTSSLKVRDEETRSTAVLSTNSRFITLPPRFKSMRKIIIQTSEGDQDLGFVSPDQLRVHNSAGRPCLFTVTSQIELDRVPDDSYVIEVQYLGDIPAITSAAPTNGLLTTNPNIYLFGGLWAAMKYGGDKEMEQNYYQQFINAIDGANERAEEGRYGPTPVITQSEVIV